MVVYAFQRSVDDRDEPPRLGLAVSRSVGNAVQRNRVKRVLREQFSGIATRLRSGIDVVVIARPGLAEYIAERGGDAAGERLCELALRVAGPASDTRSDERPRLED